MERKQIRNTNFFLYEDGRILNRTNGNFIHGNKISVNGQMVEVSQLLVEYFGSDQKETPTQSQVNTKPIEGNTNIEETPKAKKPRDRSGKAVTRKRVGEKNPKFKGFYIVNGNPYASANDAGKAVKKSRKTIIEWCKQGKHGCKFIPR